MNPRWQKAQRAEVEYHKTKSPGNPDDCMKAFKIDFPLGKVLEIGCSPTSAIHYLEADFRVGLDPLAVTFAQDYPPMNHVAAIGESLPFPDAVFDTVLCLNVLDHAMNPGRILSEIARVSKPTSRILVVVNVFRLTKAARKILGFMDAEHPWHFNENEVHHLISINRILELSSKVTEIESGNSKTKVARILGLARLNVRCIPDYADKEPNHDAGDAQYKSTDPKRPGS